MNISIRTFAHGIAAATMVGVLVLATACGSTGGVATTAPSTTSDVTTSGGGTSTVPTSVGTSTKPTSDPTGTTVTDGPASTTPVSSISRPPDCSELPNKLTTPTGEPMITVTQGANSWITNWATEPLALALYADGSGLASQGIGEANKPLAEMRIGYVPSCVLDWASSELQQLAKLDMGDAGITDQGTTTVTYRPAGGAPVKISVYALGVGDQYVTSGKENRARLTAVLAVLRKPFEGAATWTPTRLKIVAVSATVSSEGPALVWPAKASLKEVLVGKVGDRLCGVVSGTDAAAVLETLGQRDVYARWTDGGKVVGLNIGALVPGQDPCTAI